MRSTLAAAALVALPWTVSAKYTLNERYCGEQFMDESKWAYITDNDPTQGYVDYVSLAEARSLGLVGVEDGAFVMRVDSQGRPGPRGRKSVRIESQLRFDNGLLVLDLASAPEPVCGTWPAFWTYGPNWPESGEVDIMEGVNCQQNNMMAVHTGGQCNIRDAPMFGNVETTDCNVHTTENASCKIHSPDPAGWGLGADGIYAVEYGDKEIKIWFFPRENIPADLCEGGSPDPSGWGTPLSVFTGCDWARMVRQQRIVFNVTFCGVWAGNVFAEQCPGLGTCEDFVASNTQAFEQVRWVVNSVSHYQGPPSQQQQQQPQQPQQNQPGSPSKPPVVYAPVAPVGSQGPGQAPGNGQWVPVEEVGQQWPPHRGGRRGGRRRHGGY